MSPATTTTLRTAIFLGLVLAAYLLGRAHGIRETTEALARTRLTTWGAQVEAAAPSSLVVSGAATVPAEKGWKRVSLSYHLRRRDGAEPTPADMAASLREWCVTTGPGSQP